MGFDSILGLKERRAIIITSLVLASFVAWNWNVFGFMEIGWSNVITIRNAIGVVTLVSAYWVFRGVL